MPDRDPQINISRIPVAGVGGFGLVLVVVAMAAQMPVVRSFVVGSLAGGVLCAAARVLYLWWKGPGTSGPESILMLDDKRKIRSGSESAEIASRNLVRLVPQS